MEGFMDVMANLFPPDGNTGLACPFVKHDPEAYKHARNSCTLNGYSSISALKEHIKRVHLLKFGCLRCNNRFTGKEADLASWKQTHACVTNIRKLRQDPGEVTTKEQDMRFLALDFRSSGLAGEAAFKQIFRAFWPEVPEKEVPDAYFQCGFLFSIPQISAALEMIEQRRYNAQNPSPGPQAPVLPVSSPDPGTDLYWGPYLNDITIEPTPFIFSEIEGQSCEDSGYHTLERSERDSEHNLVRMRAVNSRSPWEHRKETNYLVESELDPLYLPPYRRTVEKRSTEFVKESVTDSVKTEFEDLPLAGNSSSPQQLKMPSSPSSKESPPNEPHLLTELRKLSVDEEWDSILHQLDENIRWDTQLTRTTQGYSCWTCTADSASADSIPLTIAGKAVVIPVRWHMPILPALSSPPDPHPRHISPLATLSEKTIDSILSTFDGALGFYLLINGDLQIIVGDDYDIPYAACHKPSQFGGLKVSYIFQSLTPTATERSANLPTSAEASSNTPRRLSKQQSSARPTGQARGTDRSDLAIGSPVRVVINGSKSKDRFEGRLGLRTKSNQGTFVTIPTHLVTMSLAASKVPHEGPITACHDIRILAGNKALQASPSLSFAPAYRLPVCLHLMQPQLGSLTHCFDGEAKTFPDDFQHDISLVDVGHLPAAIVSGLAPRERLEWLSPAEWDQLKLNTSKIYLLGDSKHEAKTIGLSPIPQYQMVGQGIFCNRQNSRRPRFRNAMSRKGKEREVEEEDAASCKHLVARSVLYRVHPDFSPRTGQSGNPICLRGEVSFGDAPKPAKVIGFASFVQMAEDPQHYNMEGEPLYERLEKGRVAFYGAFQVPSEMRDNYTIE